MIQLFRQGLSYIMDNVTDYYNSVGQSDRQDVVKNKNSLHDSGFVSPANITLPLAKIIPVLSSQVRLSLLDMSPVEVFSSRFLLMKLNKTCGCAIYQTIRQSKLWVQISMKHFVNNLPRHLLQTMT